MNFKVMIPQTHLCKCFNEQASSSTEGSKFTQFLKVKHMHKIQQQKEKKIT